MDIAVSDYEKLGKFYLGRGYDVTRGELEESLTLYDSKDLVTHGAVLGMTGSGKTGLCLGLLEEAAMDNIPAIVIDPKGDIPNLMLAFPEFRGADFEPWVNADDARKKGQSVSEFAQGVATMWKEGIADWGQSGERVAQFREKVDINVFTPGSKAGIPVSILSSLDVPPFEVRDDGELLGERIESTVSSLLSLVGVDADPIQSREAVLLASIFNFCWQAGESLSLESLIRNIQRPQFGKVGVIDVESFYPEKDRQKLALKFNNLLASPGFSTWLEGPALDIQQMLYTPEGKARISIFSIAHLSDSERMFFVSLLLNQMLGWMRAQSGTTSLRALLYIDEIFGYLPPVSNPPSKKPLMTMLKQARAFGLGVLVATQNPVDLDYKALSNIGTWWLGRLQTERDKLRVLDGLEGAMSEGGANFDRSRVDQLLSGLGSRVFLMNNVHENAPTVFHVRWVMSYLRGPLTRRQIKTLMDPKRALFEEGKPSRAAANPMMRAAVPSAGPKGERPPVGQGVRELFAPFAGEADGIEYLPALLREAEVHFLSRKANREGSRRVRFVNPIGEGGIHWEVAYECGIPLATLQSDPRRGAGFGPLPGYAMNADNYKPVEDEFEELIYREERMELFYCQELDAYSQFGEGEGDFRARLRHQAHEARDEAVEELREKYEKKLRSKEDQLERAELALEKEKAQAHSATMQTGARIVGGLLGALLGGRKSRGSTVTSATRAYQQRADVKVAERKVERLEEDVAYLQRELAEEIAELDRDFAPENLAFERLSISPYKKDIAVTAVALLWLPFDERGEPVW
ncbi:helicase HerA domain-containing protein [Roseibacillus ishigakijimensis]|uniref:DUF87 domain-containing protein n=1 Tax=Roseibacillus ishigakijimensis TaxID=454146 RepID=A0A934VMQ4_9BACT|nr:DUF87 domain-containing protein [Roseibacillus ishigakijimensis]MBK1834200.1 DUF87 domain-containing protein [Roseibacillus ishigakijimensis]